MACHLFSDKVSAMLIHCQMDTYKEQIPIKCIKQIENTDTFSQQNAFENIFWELSARPQFINTHMVFL